jgi:CheY-like chemotaxis protein/DNA-binding XRE family transcriptional regulator
MSHNDRHHEHESHDAAFEGPLLNVFALDDDADFREYIRTILEAEGHTVRTAATAEEFFSRAEEQLPDVALLDMKMGNESGERVLEEIRRRWARLCVIVVTGYPSLDSMRQTFKKDVFDYLAKPFSLDELRRTLGQAAQAFGLGQRPQDRLRHELGRQIRLARTERGWTLKDLSESCGVSVSQLSSVERGSHLPSIESLLAIAGALDKRASLWLGAAGL